MISKQEVEHIAKLARLGLTQVEIKKFQKELSLVLDYFNSLKEVQVVGAKSTSHLVLVENVTREDKEGKLSPKLANELIKSAPDREGRYVRVKAVL